MVLPPKSQRLNGGSFIKKGGDRESQLTLYPEVEIPRSLNTYYIMLQIPPNLKN